MRWREGFVTELGRSWTGAQELTVSVGDTAVRALAYPDLVGLPLVADRVLLNVGALDRGLGTGGYALVVAIPDRLPADPPERGHLVKARYTPLQSMVLGADEQDSPDHEVLRDADDLAGTPVVVADLHSALPAVLAGVYDARPGTRVVYVMTDGGALPLAFSRTVPALQAAGWLTGTVTVGQAYGGDREAVTVHTGLLTAVHVLAAEVVVLTQGPGNLGTGTRWGFSGVQSGEAVNAIGTLGGRAVASLRISEADPRARHRGISHHSLTAYGRVALQSADVVVPDLPGEFGDLVRDAAEPLHARHHVVRVSVAGLYDALAAAPVELSTMGRDLDGDRAYFEAAAAAGRHAAGLVGLSPLGQGPRLS
jgi:hypothetical protein